MSGVPGIDAMDPWAHLPEDENPFADLAAIVLRDDAQDLPFGATYTNPDGDLFPPATAENIAAGLQVSPIGLLQLEASPDASSASPGLVPLAFFAFAAWVLLKGTK